MFRVPDPDSGFDPDPNPDSGFDPDLDLTHIVWASLEKKFKRALNSIIKKNLPTICNFFYFKEQSYSIHSPELN